MQKQLKDFSDVELKAIAYDTIAKIEQEQKTLQTINNELASRANKKAQPKPKMEEEVKVEGEVVETTEETVETPTEEATA